MTRDELVAKCRAATTVDVRTAAQALGEGTNAAYEQIRADTFPCRTLRLGRKIRIPSADLLAVLGIVDDAEPP